MTKFRYSRTTWVDRYVPFGLFAGQASGVILLGVSLVLMLAAGFRPSLIDPLRAASTAALGPSLTYFSVPFQGLAGGLDYLFSLTRLRAEVSELRAENKRLEEWFNAAQLLQAENHSLRGLLSVKVQLGLETITTRVIGDWAGPYAQTILIRAGSDDGVNKGDAVLAGGGLIGRVIAVAPQTAAVLLMTDVASRIPVRIEGTNVQAIMAGTNGPHLPLMRIAEGSTARNGQRVFTSGIGGVLPPDLPLGVVHRDHDGRVTVRPYADFGRLLWVRVIKIPARPAAPTIDQPNPNRKR
jgi:rod shape-determining protein MreC